MLARSNTIADHLVSFFELSNTVPELKRRLFILVQLICILLLLADIVLAPFLAMDFVNIAASAVMILYLTTTTWLLWRRRERQELILFAVFFGAAFFLLLLMIYNAGQPTFSNSPQSLIQNISPWLIWFILLYMIGFLTFRAKTALRLALVISALFITFLLVYVFAMGTSPGVNTIYEVFVLAMANGLTLLLAYPLALSQERNSETDFLTGLANRTRGYSMLVNEIERAERYNTNFSLILFDLDYFKKINDSHGHPCGDAVLREMAFFVNEHMRRTDLVCRWGGEEFLLVMTHTDLASACLKANHLRQQIKNRPFHQTIPLTASFGVTSYYPHDSTNTLLQRADDALYRAKRNGRNCVETE